MNLILIKHTFKRYWPLILIPFVPVALNYLLPIANWSRIGGDDSLQVWLSFWASFSNSLIYCLITFWVLYRQIKNDTEQNTLNRSSNEKENYLNRQENVYQNKQNREISLNSIRYNSQLSQLNGIIPICSEYVLLYDISDIKKLKRPWLSSKYSKEYCLNFLNEKINHIKKTWYRFLLSVQSCDNIDISFIETQKNHINRLYNMLYMIKKYFSNNVDDFKTEDGRLRIIESLNNNDLDITFNNTSDPFWQIEYEFTELGLNSIQSELEYFVINQKEKISNIING